MEKLLKKLAINIVVFVVILAILIMIIPSQRIAMQRAIVKRLNDSITKATLKVVTAEVVNATVKEIEKNVVAENVIFDKPVVILDNEYCKFQIEGIEPNGFWGYTLIAYVENKTDYTAMFGFDHTSVNGYMIDPFWATEVCGHKATYSYISFSDSAFETAHISADKIDFIEFEFDMHETNTYEEFCSGQFVFSPSTAY